jgi:hypothetical protein
MPTHKCTVNPPIVTGITFGDPVVDPNRPCCKDWRDKLTGLTLDKAFALCCLRDDKHVPQFTCGDCYYCHKEE